MLLRHALLRIRATFVDPFDVLLLLFSGLVTLVFWPGLTDPAGAGWLGSVVLEDRGIIFSLAIVLLWLVMWPMIAGSPLRGRSIVTRRSPAFAVHAHPALPIGTRGRIVAEALAILAIVMVIRTAAMPFGLFGEVQQVLLEVGSADSWRGAYLRQSLAGALVMLPFLLLAGRAATSMETYWFRLLLLSGALFAALKLGLLETLPLCAATSVALAALTLLVPDRQTSGSELPGLLVPSARLTRPFRPPESQFRRDLWQRPLPIIASLLGAEVSLVLVDRVAKLPDLAFYFASVLVFSLLLGFVPLQPMRSKMALAGIFGKPGFQPGDFAAAYSLLPVRRQVIARGVFLFALLTTAGIWFLVVGTIVLSSWFATGEIGLIDSDGHPLGRLLIPSLGLVPAVAALATCAAVGNRKGALIAGGMFLLLPQVGLLMLIYKASGLWITVVPIVFAVLAVLPAVKHLRALEA